MFADALVGPWTRNKKLIGRGRKPKRGGRFSFRPLLEQLEDRALLAADLQITKTDNLATAVPGTSVTYNIVVTNAGPDSVTGAVVADALPTALAGATFTATGTGGAANFDATGSGSINDTVDLPAGSAITYVVTGTISASATGSLTNTATVTAPAGVDDSNLANNTATDINLILAPGTAVVTVNPNDPTQNILLVTGTAKSDHISISLAANNQVQVMLKNQVLGTFDAATFSSIVVYGQAGNDHVEVSPQITASAEIHGGAGNDHLSGGGGNDQIFGDAGNDRLLGNAGNDLLDAGAGNDQLLGGLGDDRLLGGPGNDTMNGGGGNDTFDGGGGKNHVTPNVHASAVAAVSAELTTKKPKKN